MSFQVNGVPINAPVGTIVAYVSSSINPDGWIPCDGSIISDSNYPSLVTFLTGTTGTATLPNMNNYFLRGTGTVTTTSPSFTYSGPNVRSVQSDSIRDHTHNIPYTYNDKDGGGSVSVVRTIISGSTGTTDLSGTETRPINYGIIWIIKA